MKRYSNEKHLLFLIICSVLLFQFFGCNGEKPEPEGVTPPQTQRGVEKIPEVKALEAKVNALAAKNKELSKKNGELFEEVKKHEEQKQAMSKRIKRLVDGYQPGIWTTEDAGLFPVFKKALKSADAKRITEALNYEFNQEELPRVIFNKQENNTVFIGIANSEHLTRRMGTSGALSYMASVTYSITSAKGVDCVFFDFEEGDHAIPGRYCKHSFEPFTLQ
ncbi:MAG: hypothetical protein OEV42_05600 [Deltaproteobacteria bacterium]|nr:hypothetical protein [Deltaproteobacteria bacterium]